MLQLLQKKQQFEGSGTVSSLRDALIVVTQQPREAYGSKILMTHETEALLQVLDARNQDDDHVEGLIDFLRLVDPLKDSGFDEARLEAYIASATASLSQPLWLTRAFEHLGRAQAQVAKGTGMRLFRTTFLKAAIAFFITQLPPQEVEPIHATG